MGIEHEKLAEDLAYHLGNTPFLDVPLGSVYLNSSKVQRADLIKIHESYNKFSLSIYEVKHSRNDFLSDIRTEKWKGYLKYCHRFYFAIESGIAKIEEIPEEAGLIIRGKNGWRVLKQAQVQEIEIPKETLLSLLFMKQRKSIKEKNDSNFYRYNSRRDYDDFKESKKLFGKRIANILKKEEDFKNIIYTYHQNLSSLEYLLEDFKKIMNDTIGFNKNRDFIMLNSIYSVVYIKIIPFLENLQKLLKNKNIETSELINIKNDLENNHLIQGMMKITPLNENQAKLYEKFLFLLEDLLKEFNEFIDNNPI